ncbi:MAG: hypothetical protein JST66_01360 [Bacteroidetes bacterium]|nr:hypothetical protein [Bacteroidota bacterium]
MLTAARLLFVTYLMSVCLPAAILVNFLAQRDRIVREVCVQRMVPEGRRTCHGQCHLARQLKEAQGDKDEGTRALPMLRFEQEFVEALMDFAMSVPAGLPAIGPLAWNAGLLAGYPASPRVVPWV